MAKKTRYQTRTKRSTAPKSLIAGLTAFIILFFGSLYLAYSHGIGPLARLYSTPANVSQIRVGTSTLPMSDTPELNAAAAAYQAQQAGQTTTQQQQAAQQAAQQTIQRLAETRVSTTSTSSVQEAVQEIAREQGVQVSSTSTPSQVVNQVAERIVTTNPVVQNVLNSSASSGNNTPPNTCATSGSPVQVGSWVATGTYEKDKPLTVEYALCKKCEANGSFSRSTELCLQQLEAGQSVILPTYQHVFPLDGANISLFKCFAKVNGVTVQIPAGGSAVVDGKTQYCNPANGEFVTDRNAINKSMEPICALQGKIASGGICVNPPPAPPAAPPKVDGGKSEGDCLKENRVYIAAERRCGDVRQCGPGWIEDGKFCKLNPSASLTVHENIIKNAETRCNDAGLPFDQNTGLCQDPTAGKPVACEDGKIERTSTGKYVLNKCIKNASGIVTGTSKLYCAVPFVNNACPSISATSKSCDLYGQNMCSTKCGPNNYTCDANWENCQCNSTTINAQTPGRRSDFDQILEDRTVEVINQPETRQPSRIPGGTQKAGEQVSASNRINCEYNNAVHVSGDIYICTDDQGKIPADAITRLGMRDTYCEGSDSRNIRTGSYQSCTNGCNERTGTCNSSPAVQNNLSTDPRLGSDGFYVTETDECDGTILPGSLSPLIHWWRRVINADNTWICRPTGIDNPYDLNDNLPPAVNPRTGQPLNNNANQESTLESSNPLHFQTFSACEKYRKEQGEFSGQCSPNILWLTGSTFTPNPASANQNQTSQEGSPDLSKIYYTNLITNQTSRELCQEALNKLADKEKYECQDKSDSAVGQIGQQIVEK